MDRNAFKITSISKQNLHGTLSTQGSIQLEIMIMMKYTRLEKQEMWLQNNKMLMFCFTASRVAFTAVAGGKVGPNADDTPLVFDTVIIDVGKNYENTSGKHITCSHTQNHMN